MKVIMKKLLICMFVAAGLSGCHIYKAYQRPEAIMPDSLYRQSEVTCIAFMETALYGSYVAGSYRDRA